MCVCIKNFKVEYLLQVIVTLIVEGAQPGTMPSVMILIGQLVKTTLQAFSQDQHVISMD
jgi:hypothetical protein